MKKELVLVLIFQLIGFKMKTVTVNLSTYQAAVVRQVLFEAQKGYSYGPTAPERVFEIREVVTDLDDAIEEALKD